MFVLEGCFRGRDTLCVGGGLGKMYHEGQAFGVDSQAQCDRYAQPLIAVG